MPILFTSNLTKQRILKAFEEAMEAYENRNYKIPTSQLNDFLLPIIQNQPPPMYKGKMVRIKYVTQIKSRRRHSPSTATCRSTSRIRTSGLETTSLEGPFGSHHPAVLPRKVKRKKGSLVMSSLF